jgi:beta-galactosidase GanA
MADGKKEIRPVFFTGFGAFGQAVADIEKWPDYGTNIIEVQYGPGLVFPAEGVTSDAPMRELQSILDRAQKAGVAVDLMLCPHYFPNWAYAKWPHLSKRREDFLKFCLHAPEGQDLLRRHITALITPIANHPALHSVCLANEPTAVEEACQPARDQWHMWLQEHHKDIKTLNVRYGSAYASFDAVPLPDPYGPQPAMPLWMDFVRFNQEFMAQWHQMLADAVHKVAPSLPVHTKPIIDRVIVNTTWPSIGAKSGLDATLFARFSNINGCDALMYYGWGQLEFANNWRASMMGYDLLRSALDAPVFNSENHPIPDRDNRVIPASHMRCVLWQQAIHGQSATVLWVWQPSFGHDPKSELDGNTMYRPACTEAVGVANCDLNRAAYEVTALQQAKPDVLLLHSVTASVWEPQRFDQSLLQLYTALSFTGLKIGFVTERQLEIGLVPHGPVVIVPDIAHLSDAAVACLRKFTGHLLLAGGSDVLAFDQYGHDRKERLPGEHIEPVRGTTDTAKGLRTVLQAKLSDWSIRPAIDVRGEDHQPPWGVEWRCAKTDAGVLVNLCNYLNVPTSISLNRDGHSATGRDLLTGQPLTDAIKLQPLEVRLVLVNHDAATK